jgi:hypothetical protein
MVLDSLQHRFDMLAFHRKLGGGGFAVIAFGEFFHDVSIILQKGKFRKHL